MSTNFKYVPTSGDLSGKSFEEQTERAFNELGQEIDDGNAIATQALNTANEALAVANSSTETAQTALASAQTALTTANTALSEVTTAQSDAAVAKARADEAYDMAATAITTSQNAEATANAAEAVASTVQARADDAYALAETANTTAEDAGSLARNGLGEYVTEAEAELDADAFFTSASRLYVESNEIENFPIYAPLYFDVNVSDNGVSVQQIVRAASFTDTDPVFYMRTGTIADDSPTWGAWKTTGGGGSAIVGKIDLLPFRASELPYGWYFCNGDQYALTSAPGIALNSLSANFKADWSIAVSGANISLPNLFFSDGRGFFMRSVNGTTRQVGSAENHAVETFETKFQWGTGDIRAFASGTFSGGTGFNIMHPLGTNHTIKKLLPYALDTTTQISVSSETRALNVGMTPAIFLGV